MNKVTSKNIDDDRNNRFSLKQFRQSGIYTVEFLPRVLEIDLDVHSASHKLSARCIPDF